MSGFLIWLAIVGPAVFFLWKKVKAADDRLRSDRAQREADMLAQALAMRTNQEKKRKETGSGELPID